MPTLRRAAGTAAAVHQPLGQGLRGVHHTGGRVEPHAAQVQRQRRIHGLRMLGKPPRQLASHHAQHLQVAPAGTLSPFAHDLQHHLVLHAVAVARGKARAGHPLVFHAEMLLGVGDERLPAGQQLRAIAPPAPGALRTPRGSRPSAAGPVPVRQTIPVLPCAVPFLQANRMTSLEAQGQGGFDAGQIPPTMTKPRTGRG